MATQKGTQPGVISRRVAPFVPLAVSALSLHAPSLGPEAVSTTAVRETTEPSALHLSCPLPFAALEERHPIDDTCGADGSSSPNTAQALQNEAKNNFCSTSSPVVLTFDQFGQLQKNAEDAGVTFGTDSQLPKSRSALKSLLQVSGSGTVGEGNVVRLAAYVKDAHYSNVSNGESVNCKTKGQESNDIHIVLVEKPEDKACTSVTAEMSPHFRPEIWTPTTINHIGSRPLRFTGQLFFDGSHRPCEGGAEPNPQRRSLFEIHPVYSVDVCNNVPAAGAAIEAVCDPKSDADWKKLEDFTGAEVESESSESGTP